MLNTLELFRLEFNLSFIFSTIITLLYYSTWFSSDISKSQRYYPLLLGVF